jgi:thiol:disulfide interchange protein
MLLVMLAVQIELMRWDSWIAPMPMGEVWGFVIVLPLLGVFFGLWSFQSAEGNRAGLVAMLLNIIAFILAMAMLFRIHAHVTSAIPPMKMI